MELFENILEVRAVAGDNFLGGEDFITYRATFSCGKSCGGAGCGDSFHYLFGVTLGNDFLFDFVTIGTVIYDLAVSCAGCGNYGVYLVDFPVVLMIDFLREYLGECLARCE